EDLLSRPQSIIEDICEFLGIDFHPGMLEPYKDKEKRMTDGLHGPSRMLGDVKFHQFNRIDPAVAERWRNASDDSLGEPTWELAERVGYKRERAAGTKADSQRLDEIAVVSREPGKKLPLSFSQQRLWFLTKLDPDSSAYNIHSALQLEGVLDRVALQRSLSEVVSRHATLRTSFHEADGSPVHVISPPAPLALPLIDLSNLADGRRENEVRRLAGEEARRPFDLREGRLMRVGLLRLAEREHVVLFTTHHIVSDGWSIGVLVREVASLYKAFSRGEASPLAELPIQYADFAFWQRDRLQGDRLREQLDYWRRQLAGAPQRLEIPTDYRRPETQTYKGAVQSLLVSFELSERLKRLGNDEGVTLFMMFLAAFDGFLSCYTAQEDIVVGTDVAN